MSEPEKKFSHTYIHTLNKLNNNNNNNNNKAILFNNDPKVVRTYYVHYSLAESFKDFCDLLHMSASAGVEYAIMDFMQDHVADIPAKVTFNLVAKTPIEVSADSTKSEQCGFHGCKEDAVGSGVWKGKETYALCAVHLAEAREKPQEWKLAPELE